MKSKSARNLIIALAILAIGIKLVMIVFNNYLSRLVIGNMFPDMVGSVENLGTLMIYGIIVLIVLSVPFYLSARSKEKGVKKAAEPEKTK